MAEETTAATEQEAATTEQADETAQDTTEQAAEAAKTGDKEQNRTAYEMRQLQKRLDALEKENQGYKRRDEDARKAQLTKEQALAEERDTLARENETLKTERLVDKVRAEFKIPGAIVLVGTDEESLRAHAEEVVKYLPKPRAGSATDPPRDQGQKRREYTRAELQADPKLAASDEVTQAAKEGRVK